MEKNIEIAIRKEGEYLQRKLFDGDGTANIFEYLSEGGYDNIPEFERDKFFYTLANYGITCVTDTATVLQPLAYQNYMNRTPFCYFVEYDKPFALVPFSFSQEEETKLNDFGFDCFKCGYDNGGVILTDPMDFRLCIAFNKPNKNVMVPYLLNDLYEFLLNYYPGLYVDGNDFMYEGKKVAGCSYFNTTDMCAFAIHISIVDMREFVESSGYMKEKIPGCLPHVDGLKDLLKTKVETWLRR